MRKLSPLLVLLPLLAGCTGGSVTAHYSGGTWGGGDTPPWDEGRSVDSRVVEAEAVVLQSDSSSTTDFDVTIEQSEAPPVMGRNDSTLYLTFVVTVKNRTLEPATIKRVTLENAGTDFDVDTVTKKFDVPIEPGAASKFELVARATGIDVTVGTNVPMTIRATIDSMQNKSRSRASFVRSINGHVAVSVTR
jgi:hypothetical protein